MSTSTLELPRRTVWLARAADYCELTKPRIAVLIVATIGVAHYVAAAGDPKLLPMLHAMAGVLLVAGSASAFNQWIERRRDALMARTSDRPLPAGRLAAWEVFGFGSVLLAVGLVWLVAATDWLTALCSMLTWIVYVLCYTPLKARSAWNTTIGAVAGALPMTIGWLSARPALDGRGASEAAALFLILFLWQFPHFMAIAWLYRRQYAAAGLRMLTVTDASGRQAGRLAVVSALVLAPVSLWPAWLAGAGPGLLLASAGLGAAQFACAVLFWRRLDEISARRLLRASLLYLPALLVLLILLY